MLFQEKVDLHLQIYYCLLLRYIFQLCYIIWLIQYMHLSMAIRTQCPSIINFISPTSGNPFDMVAFKISFSALVIKRCWFITKLVYASS